LTGTKLVVPLPTIMLDSVSAYMQNVSRGGTDDDN
jgi:hypothetical protein